MHYHAPMRFDSRSRSHRPSGTWSRALLRVYPVWQWLVFAPLAAVATVAGALGSIALALLVSPRVANRYAAAPWSRLIAGLTPARVTVVGGEHVRPGQSYVVVANHQSQFDIPVIYGYSGLDLRWVMKAELGKVPLVAQGCRAIGHIFIDRSNPDQSRDTINAAVERLPKGASILFFPEGTRSRSGELMRFKKGAFRVAIDHQLPVLPMTVTGTREILPPGSLRMHPGRARLTIHPPVDPPPKGASRLGELQSRVHAVIAAGIEAEQTMQGTTG